LTFCRQEQAPHRQIDMTEKEPAAIDTLSGILGRRSDDIAAEAF